MTLKFLVHVFEEFLVHVEKVTGIECSHESSLGVGKVDLPHPALHGLVLRHCDQSKVEMRQLFEDLGFLQNDGVLSRGYFECFHVICLANRQDLLNDQPRPQTKPRQLVLQPLPPVVIETHRDLVLWLFGAHFCLLSDFSDALVQLHLLQPVHLVLSHLHWHPILVEGFLELRKVPAQGGPDLSL